MSSGPPPMPSAIASGRATSIPTEQDLSAESNEPCLAEGDQGIDEIEKIKACIVTAPPTGGPLSLAGLHVYMEAGTPRVGHGQTLEATVWFQNETDAPLEVRLEHSMPLDQALAFVIDRPGAVVATRTPARSTRPASLLRFVLRSGRAGKVFHWKATGLADGHYRVTVTPPLDLTMAEAKSVRIDGMDFLVGWRR